MPKRSDDLHEIGAGGCGGPVEDASGGVERRPGRQIGMLKVMTWPVARAGGGREGDSDAFRHRETGQRMQNRRYDWIDVDGRRNAVGQVAKIGGNHRHTERAGLHETRRPGENASCCIDTCARWCPGLETVGNRVARIGHGEGCSGSKGKRRAGVDGITGRHAAGDEYRSLWSPCV